MSETTDLKIDSRLNKFGHDDDIKYTGIYKDIVIRRAEAGFCSTSIHNNSDLNRFVNDLMMSDPFLTGFSIKIDWNSSPLFKDMNYFYYTNDYTDSQRIISGKLKALCDDYQNRFDETFSEKTIAYNLVGPILGKRNRELYTEPYGAVEYLYLNDMYKVDGESKVVESIKAEDITGSNNSKYKEYAEKIAELTAEKEELDITKMDLEDKMSAYQIKQASISCNDVIDAVNTLSEGGGIRDVAMAAPPSDFTMYKGMIESIKNEIVSIEERQTAIDAEILIYTDMMNTENEKAVNTTNTLQKENSTSSPVLAAPNSVINLIRFYQTMRKINDERQFVISSIEGITEAIKYAYEFSAENQNKEFTIKFIEDVSMSITRMMTSYIEAMYDTKYRREKVPTNLRKFNMSIFVYDCRSYMNKRSIIGRALLDFCDNLSAHANKRDILSETQSETFNDYVLKLMSEHISVMEVFFTGCMIKENTISSFGELNTTVKSEGSNNTIKFTFDTIDVNPVTFTDANRIFNFLNKKEEKKE